MYKASVPAIPGIMLGVYVYATNRFDTLFVPIYTIALAVWATIFFEFWKRKQSETMFQFDMHVETEQKKKIQSFKGQFWIDDVTHQIEIQYSKRDKWKYYKTTTPLVILAIIMIAGEQIGYYYIIQLQERTTNFTIVCSIGLGISIKITNEIFNYFAKLSLKFENHQYQNELEDIYIIKVFSFAFLNSFVRPIYKSIIDPDADELNIMSITFTIVWAIMHLTKFTIIPLIKYKIRSYFLTRDYEQYTYLSNFFVISSSLLFISYRQSKIKFFFFLTEKQSLIFSFYFLTLSLNIYQLRLMIFLQALLINYCRLGKRTILVMLGLVYQNSAISLAMQLQIYIAINATENRKEAMLTCTSSQLNNIKLAIQYYEITYCLYLQIFALISRPSTKFSICLNQELTIILSFLRKTRLIPNKVSDIKLNLFQLTLGQFHVYISPNSLMGLAQANIEVKIVDADSIIDLVNGCCLMYFNVIQTSKKLSFLCLQLDWLSFQ